MFLGVTATEAVAKRRRPVNSILLPRLWLLQCGFVYRGPWGGGWESLCQAAHFKQEPLEVDGAEGLFCKLWVGFTIVPVGTTGKGPRS